MTVEDLALARYDRAALSAETRPDDALKACFAELEQRQVRSVYICIVMEDGTHGYYSAGPDVGTLGGAWRLLQDEAFHVIERMAER